jgi:hypothetical protein
MNPLLFWFSVEIFLPLEKTLYRYVVKEKQINFDLKPKIQQTNNLILNKK